MHVQIFHNVVWSRYKGAVFSALYKLGHASGWNLAFIQIAETETGRVSLSPVDYSFHTYPHRVLHKKQYEQIGTVGLSVQLFWMAVRSRANMIILPGFHRPEYFAMLAGCILARKRRAVFSDSTLNDRPQTFTKSALKRVFFGLCHGYFTYGERGAQFLVKHGARPERIFLRCQAAALPVSYSAETARSMRLAKGPPADRPRVLYVGRLSAEKSLDTLLVAFAEFSHRHPAAELVIIGTGPEKASLEQLGAALGIADRARFTGAKSAQELEEEYARASFLVLPSLSEPWGLVVNEAMSYGCPALVTTACGCVPELVQPGLTGYTFTAGDSTELAEKMEQAVAAFSDHRVTTANCLGLMAKYTPEVAGQMILEGCKKIIERTL